MLLDLDLARLLGDDLFPERLRPNLERTPERQLGTRRFARHDEDLCSEVFDTFARRRGYLGPDRAFPREMERRIGTPARAREAESFQVEPDVKRVPAGQRHALHRDVARLRRSRVAA